MNKKGGFSDLFILIIVSFIIVVISGIFIYLGITTQSKLHEVMDPMATATSNTTAIIDDSFGAVNTALSSLYWISVLLMVGMIISIFIGSYLVTTRPIFFVPYIFVSIIAIIVAVAVSNAYETLATNATLGSTYAGFIGANFILSHLPIWVCLIAFIGAIIMFSRMGSNENQGYYGG